MPRHGKAVVQTLRDVLSAFPPALSRLPANQDVYKAQRALLVLEGALKELQEKI